jgi:uncharacterized protein (DUF362 family)
MSEDPYPGRLDRREALLRLSAAGVTAAAVGAGALAFHDRRRVTATAEAVPDWRTPRHPGSRVGATSRTGDPARDVRRVVEALGGMASFVSPGARVLVKPNIGWDRIPEQAANTDPRVVAELVTLCREAGAGRVVVTDISCNDPRRSFARSGIAVAAAEAGAKVIPTAELHLRPAALTGLAAGIEVIEELLVADRVINVPVVKHHSLSGATLGMKNWLGVLGPGRSRLHQDIHRAVAELGAVFRPTLTVMDATRVLMRNGPQGGSLGDVKAVGAVAAGVDPVACDAWGAVQMGLEPLSLGFIAIAQQRGLGRANAGLLAEVGTA